MTQVAASSLVGQHVGDNFFVEKLLGEGGMGAVWVAVNRDLGKRIAIKVLLREYANHPVVVRRFIQEARAACAATDENGNPHPNIINILGNGQFADGSHYIKMEYVEGCDLAHYLHEFHPLPIDRVLEIVAQIVAALDVVHRLRIVHRDLKPANVLIAATAGNLVHVKVLDFGIAQLSKSPIEGSYKTEVPVVMGTRGYWSPEQARGQEVDTRSDIFSLGVIVYEMLTGQLPSGAHPTDPRQLRADLNEQWAGAVMSALALDPDHRPPTVRAFLQPLIEGTEDGHALVADAAPSLYRSADAADFTMKHGSDKLPVAGAVRTPPPASTTTLGQAAGQATRSRAGSRTWPRYALAAALVVVLGVAGALIAAVTSGKEPDRSRAEHSEPPASPDRPAATLQAQLDAAPTPSVSAPPAPKIPKLVQLTVETKPPEASIYIAGETSPRGKGSVALSLEPGQEVTVRATLRGYRDQLDTITVPAANDRVVLRLEPLRSRTVTRARKREPAQPQRHHRTPTRTPSLPSSGVLE